MNLTRLIIVFGLACSVSAALVTENLIIHLDAGTLTGLNGGDVVVFWADSATEDSVDGSVTAVSGYGSPTYKTNQLGGKPVLRFVRQQEDLMVSSNWSLPNPSAGLTIFVVCTGGSSGSVERVAQIGAAAGTASHLMAVDVSASASGCRYNNGYSLTLAGSNPVASGLYHIGIRQMTQGGRHDSLYYAVNGLIPEPLTCNNPGNLIVFDAADNHISIGSGMDPSGVWYPDFYNGDLAELLVYNAQLSSWQISQTAEYLSSKYALPFESAAVLVLESNGDTTVREGGAADRIDVALTADPGMYPVTIQLRDFLNPNQVQVMPAELVFTSSDWQTPQSVIVAAIDDDQMERATHDTQLELIVLADPSSPYYNISLSKIWVNIEDNDCGSLGFSPADYNLDCVVDLEDFSIFVLEWIESSIPDPACQGF